ncbi:MAG: zinc-ribbon domain-containing protein [Enhydrobacter sp.]|nr:zinc-ribbon domain-containing protein [Enhydrobacter sp.]
MVVTCPNCGSRYAVDPLAIGPAGRKVQCVRCNHRWFQKVESASPLPDVVIRPTPAGASTALPVVIPPRPGIAVRRLIAIGVAAVVLVAATLFAFRREIANMISYEARASTPVQVTAAAVPPSAAVPTGQATATAATSVTAPAAVSAATSPSPSPPPSVLRTTPSNAGATPPPAARPARPPVVGGVGRPNIEVDLASSKIEVVDGRYVVRGQLVNNGKAAGSTTQLRLVFKKNDEVLGERSLPMVEGPLPPGGRMSFSQPLDDPPSGTTDIVPVVE